MTQWPSVGIVIPVYNAPEMLERCATSLEETDYPGDWVRCYVDNASTDTRTLKMLKGWLTEGIAFTEPVGFAQAVNDGMHDLCDGKRYEPEEDTSDVKYFVLFNQDCEVLPGHEDWLTNLINWMEQRPQCAIAGAKLVHPDGTMQHCGMELPAGSCGVHRLYRESPDIPEANYYEKMQSVTGAVYCIRRSALEEIGYLDEGYLLGCEDTELCLRAASYGWEVWYVPESVVLHQDHGVRDANPQDSQRIRQWQHESDAKFRRDWGPFVDLCASSRCAIVLPDWNSAAGGCRVVGGIANAFINAGLDTTVYVMNESDPPTDPDFPQLFDVRPLAALQECEILIATRFDTVAATKHIPARKRWYLVQADERPMVKYCGGCEQDVIDSWRDTDYEIITIGDHLASMLHDYGRTVTVLDVGLYRNLYPYVPREQPHTPFRALMYYTPADYKGAEDAPLIAAAIRDRMGRENVEIQTFHRAYDKPEWSDRHFQPQSTSEVAAVYAQADVYVYASLSDGFAMTPVEAMACGTPVVLTDFPGKDQYARWSENCRLVGYRDIAEIANAVDCLAARYDTVTDIIQGGLATADRYDWSRVGRQYLEVVAGVPRRSE
jgi:GT2 family glycosyltransferase